MTKQSQIWFTKNNNKTEQPEYLKDFKINETDPNKISLIFDTNKYKAISYISSENNSILADQLLNKLDIYRKNKNSLTTETIGANKLSALISEKCTYTIDELAAKVDLPYGSLSLTAYNYFHDHYHTVSTFLIYSTDESEYIGPSDSMARLKGNHIEYPECFETDHNSLNLNSLTVMLNPSNVQEQHPDTEFHAFHAARNATNRGLRYLAHYYSPTINNHQVSIHGGLATDLFPYIVQSDSTKVTGTKDIVKESISNLWKTIDEMSIYLQDDKHIDIVFMPTSGARGEVRKAPQNFVNYVSTDGFDKKFPHAFKNIKNIRAYYIPYHPSTMTSTKTKKTLELFENNTTELVSLAK